MVVQKIWLISGLSQFTQELKNMAETQLAVTVFGSYFGSTVDQLVSKNNVLQNVHSAVNP